jgi:hypothetical protein
MAFYFDNTDFNKDKDIACLVEGCDSHENIFNPAFIVNIHDPFDGTNPGRIKKRDEELFVNSL